MTADKKELDCVQMKWDIQQELAKEYAGLTSDAIRRKQAEKIAKNPIIGRLLKKSASPSRKSGKRELAHA